MSGVNALIIALSDPRVIDALSEVLILCINSAVQSAISTFNGRLGKQDAVIECLNAENIEMKKRIIVLEAYSRMDNTLTKAENYDGSLTNDCEVHQPQN